MPEGQLVEHRHAERPPGACRGRPRSTFRRASRRPRAAGRRSRSPTCRRRRRPRSRRACPRGGAASAGRRRSTAAPRCPRRRGSRRRSRAPTASRASACRSQRQPPTSGPLALPGAIARTYGSSGSRGTSPTTSPRSTRSSRSRLNAVVSLCAHADEPVAVEGREAGALADRHVQRGDVAVADERLRVRGDHVEVEVGDHLARAEAALQRLHDVDLGVGEERVQVVGAALRRRRRRSRRGRGRPARA